MNDRKRIALLIGGNLFTALGGGVLFAQGIDLMSKLQYFKFDSILTYLVAVLLELVIILRARRKSISAFWGYTAVAFGLAVMLIGLWPRIGTGLLAEIALFTVLTTFFSFSFIPRFLRADYAAKAFDRLNFAELSYWAGYLLMLAIWPKDTSVGATLAPPVAASFLLFALLCDLGTRSAVAGHSGEASARESTTLVLRDGVFLSGLMIFTALTLGVQIAMKRITSLSGSTMPIVAFDIGILIASVLCAFRRFPITSVSSGMLGESTQLLPKKPVPLSILTIGTFCTSFLAVWTYGLNFTLVGSCLFGLAALAYEVTSMVILSEMGRRWGGVSLAFSLCGVVAAFAYAGLLYSSSSSTHTMIFVLVCSAIPFLYDRSWFSIGKPTKQHANTTA